VCVVVVAECKRTEGPRGGGAAAGAVRAAAVDVAGAPAVCAAAARGGRGAGGRRRPPERGDARRGHGHGQLWPAGVGGERNRAGPRRRLLPAALLPLLRQTKQEKKNYTATAPHLISLDAFNLFVNKHEQTHTNTVF
jgi:hypothetical protein